LRLLGSYGGGQRQEVGQGQGCTLDKELPGVMESTSDSPPSYKYEAAAFSADQSK